MPYPKKKRNNSSQVQCEKYNCNLLKEDNQRQYFLAFCVRMDLLQTEVQNTKKKIDKFATIKMKDFWSSGYTVMAVKQ